MNVCRKNRKAIVLLMMDELTGPEAAELVGHLEQCDGCRRYRDEILLVTQRLNSVGQAAALPTEDMQDAPAVRRSRSTRAGWRRTGQPPSGSPLGWRLAAPALAAIALTAVLLVALLRHPASPSAASQQVETVPMANPPTDLTPTLANYRAVAIQSLDELDDLLTRQARSAAHVPTRFTAATLALVSVGD